MLGKRGGYPYGKYSQQRKRAKAFPAIAANQRASKASNRKGFQEDKVRSNFE